MKLALAIPSCGTIKSSTVFCLIRLIKNLKCDFVVLMQEGSIVHRNREMLVKAAFEQQCTHILFIDSDMYFEGDAANRLTAHEKAVVGVNYFHRKLPKITTVHMEAEKKKNLATIAPLGFTTCDSVATGFLLIDLEVFKKLSHPWFFWESDKEGEVETGEDYWFCRKAREAGFEIWVDLTIPIGHIGDYRY